MTVRINSILLALALTPVLISSASPCEFPVCAAQGEQGYPLIAPDGGGGALIAWQDFRNGVDYEVYVQRVQPSIGGLSVAPGWPTDGVAATQHSADQGPQVIISDGAGGAFVVWADLRDVVATGADIYAQHVTAEGAIAMGWPVEGRPLCTAPRYQVLPRAISDGAGGAIVVWEDYRAGGGLGEPGSNPDIYGIRILPDGSIATGWAMHGNPVCTAPGFQGSASLVADGFGGAVLAWGDGRDAHTTGGDIYATRITAGGTIAAGWPTDGVALSAAPGGQGGYVRIVTDGTGGAIVGWEDYRNDPSQYPYPDLYAQRVLADGSLAPGWPTDGVAVAVAPDYQWNADMASDGAGGAFLVWEDYRNYNSSAADLFGQRITGSGTVAAGWPENGKVVATGAGWQLKPSVVSDGQGGILVAFESYPSGDYDVYAQRVMSDGTLAPDWPAEGRPLCTGTEADDARPAAVSDGMHGMIVASEHGTFATGHDIYANWVPGDGPTPALVALAGADAQPDRVTLAWYGAEAAGLAATVERRSEPGDWSPLATLTADGTGTFRYEDRTVVPGTRYGYRLRYRGGAEEQLTEPHWVTVPAPTFALHGARPHPARGDLVVEFSLGSAEPARLDLYDPSGRRVLEHELPAPGPGRHRLNLSQGRPLPAGVYTMLLRQGEQRDVTRAVMLR